MTQYGLPKWPQKANIIRQVRAMRRRIRKEVEAVNALAVEQGVPTEGRGVLQVLDDIEWLAEQQPGASPTYEVRG